MSRGSRYSDNDRRKAVQEYLVCGSLAMVGEVTGIPRKTLADWSRSEWWDQLTAELRQERGEPELAGEDGEVAKTKLGRPTSYKPEYAEQARKLCLLGGADQDMADFFHVTEQTVNNWKDKHPEFFESIRQGKIVADANVASSLYERSLGVTCSEEKEVVTTETDGESRTIKTATKKEYPPDTQAMRLWLLNRRPRQWRETIRVESPQPAQTGFQLHESRLHSCPS